MGANNGKLSGGGQRSSLPEIFTRTNVPDHLDNIAKNEEAMNRYTKQLLSCPIWLDGMAKSYELEDLLPPKPDADGNSTQPDDGKRRRAVNTLNQHIVHFLVHIYKENNVDPLAPNCSWYKTWTNGGCRNRIAAMKMTTIEDRLKPLPDAVKSARHKGWTTNKTELRTRMQKWRREFEEDLIANSTPSSQPPPQQLSAASANKRPRSDGDASPQDGSTSGTSSQWYQWRPFS